MYMDCYLFSISFEGYKIRNKLLVEFVEGVFCYFESC